MDESDFERGPTLLRDTQPFNPRATAQLWSSRTPSTVLLSETRVFTKRPTTHLGLVTLTLSWGPAATDQARTACPLLGRGCPPSGP